MNIIETILLAACLLGCGVMIALFGILAYDIFGDN